MSILTERVGLSPHLTMRAFGADDGNTPHACGVDDIACSSTATKEHAFGVDDDLRSGFFVPNPVLDVGHFSQALLGHSCQAPKDSRE